MNHASYLFELFFEETLHLVLQSARKKTKKYTLRKIYSQFTSTCWLLKHLRVSIVVHASRPFTFPEMVV